MAVTDQAVTMYAGNLRTLRVTVTDEDVVGSPAKDLTGLTVKWALSRQDTSGNFLTTPVLEKKSTTPSELTVTDAPGGEFEVYLVPADTAALFGTFYWEAEVFDATPAGVVVATGTLEILRNVVNT